MRNNPNEVFFPQESRSAYDWQSSRERSCLNSVCQHSPVTKMDRLCRTIREHKSFHCLSFQIQRSASVYQRSRSLTFFHIFLSQWLVHYPALIKEKHESRRVHRTFSICVMRNSPIVLATITTGCAYRAERPYGKHYPQHTPPCRLTPIPYSDRQSP